MELGTATQTEAPVIVDRTDLNSPTLTDANPFEVRWALNPVQRDKILNARECRIAKVPFGRFFPITSFTSPRENHSIDWTQVKEKDTVISAAEAESYVQFALGTGDAQSKTNWGLQVGFLGEKDAGKMEVINSRLFPSLSRIRSICEELQILCPISAVCEGSDELDFGARESCVTCSFAWLNSAACDAYIRYATGIDTIVSERNPGTGDISQRNVRPTLAEFDTARQMAIIGYKTGIRELESQWKKIETEYQKEDSGRKDISEFEQSYRKDLHANKPEDRQLAIVQQFAKATRGSGADNGVVMERVVGVLDRLEDRLSKLEGPKQTEQPLADPIDLSLNPETVEAQTSADKASEDPTDGKSFAERMQEAKKNKQQGAK